MFESVYKSIPPIYFSLQGVIPQLIDNNIHLTLKNDIQKEYFESKKKDVLAFLRNNFNEQINDIIINISEKAKIKKIIFDTTDKMNNFMEINNEFNDFLDILDLKIKS